MKIVKSAVAGTLESSDIQIRIEPNDNNNIDIHLESVVKKQFGKHIVGLIEKELKKLGVTSCDLQVIDKGALDFAIISRLQSVVHLGAAIENDISWEGRR